ncbi:Arc family DNA-binding protein [Acinetobacter soli]|uniref:Arc family DNA-binding protein n=2 Tax=Acinetobacter TaxID=469 RepID=UPI001D0AB3FF|nr:Arc family DNA-binding protein [Acinetobacter soli]MCB8769424.1 Arc family DNA-binding protein [Acinetobacter soli]
MYPFWGYWSIPKMGLSSILFFKPFAMTEDDNKVVTMKVRVTPEFREKLATTAKENNRSMNAEIVDRLEKSFENNQSSYIEAFTDAGVKIISHVMTSLKESGLSDDQIKRIFNDLKFNKK